MKKFIIALVAMFTMTFTTASAMSYEQARQQALFLTDKMAYELNLTDDQYEAAYEVNLDYLMGINTYDDLYGVYWRQRNLDLSYILLDWQYRAFCDATYFYRPLYWDGGFWHFGIYARYPRRDYFFFGRPHFYVSYRGDHCWRVNGGRSWYHGRSYGRPFAGGQPRMGMRDGFNRGDYGRGQSFGNMQRQSSTRTTVTRDRNFGNGSFHNSRVESNRNYNGRDVPPPPNERLLLPLLNERLLLLLLLPLLNERLLPPNERLPPNELLLGVVERGVKSRLMLERLLLLLLPKVPPPKVPPLKIIGKV